MIYGVLFSCSLRYTFSFTGTLLLVHLLSFACLSNQFNFYRAVLLVLSVHLLVHLLLVHLVSLYIWWCWKWVDGIDALVENGDLADIGARALGSCRTFCVFALVRCWYIFAKRKHGEKHRVVVFCCPSVPVSIAMVRYLCRFCALFRWLPSPAFIASFRRYTLVHDWWCDRYLFPCSESFLYTFLPVHRRSFCRSFCTGEYSVDLRTWYMPFFLILHSVHCCTVVLFLSVQVILMLSSIMCICSCCCWVVVHRYILLWIFE